MNKQREERIVKEWQTGNWAMLRTYLNYQWLDNVENRDDISLLGSIALYHLRRGK